MFQQKNLFQQLNQINLWQVSFNSELVEQVAEERHRNILNEHQAQSQRIANQRDELYQIGLALKDEVTQMNQENHRMVQEMRAQRFRANEPIDFLEPAARGQITTLRAERDLELNEARKAIAHSDEAKGLEISLLRDQISRQSQDTKLLKDELRRSSDFQEQIMAERSSLRAQREDKTELLKTVGVPCRPEGQAAETQNPPRFFRMSSKASRVGNLQALAREGAGALEKDIPSLGFEEEGFEMFWLVRRPPFFSIWATIKSFIQKSGITEKVLFYMFRYRFPMNIT